MHGAGRLTRSLRSLGPQAELMKAAAKGALILLRERLAPLRARLAEIKRARIRREKAGSEMLPNAVGCKLRLSAA